MALSARTHTRTHGFLALGAEQTTGSAEQLPRSEQYTPSSPSPGHPTPQSAPPKNTHTHTTHTPPLYTRTSVSRPAIVNGSNRHRTHVSSRDRRLLGRVPGPRYPSAQAHCPECMHRPRPRHGKLKEEGKRGREGERERERGREGRKVSESESESGE
eukprot:3683406-Rhodomonas_salina.3